MKKTLFAIAALLSVVTGCKKSNIGMEEEGFGTVSFNITSDTEGYVTKAALPEPDINGFDITVTKNGGGYAESWKYSEFPSVLDLSSGTYTVSVSSPDRKPVAWDQPVYGCSQDFSVVVGKVSNVDLKCTITNMMVTINPTENFLNELSSWQVTVKSADGTLVFDRTVYDEGKAAFFNVATLDVTVHGERYDGSAVIEQKLVIDDVAARDHHIINLDAKTTGSVGGIELTVDNTVNDKNQDVNVPGFEEIPIEDEPDPDEPGGGEDTPDPSTAPTMTWVANPDFSVTPITDPMSDVTINISAPETITGFTVKVESTFPNVLTGIALVVSEDYNHIEDGYVILDLIGDVSGAVANLGAMLPVGDAINGKSVVDFSLTGLVPMINLFTPEPGSIHTFTLTVTDAKGQSLSQPVSFRTE